MSSQHRPEHAASLDLVVPCYNPVPHWASNLSANLKRLQTLLPEVTIHLILVNDGSTKGIHAADITHLQQQIANFSYHSYPTNQGKGFALRTGVAQSTSPFCLYTDIDFPYQEASIAKIYQTLSQTTVQVAVGVRDTHYYAQVPPIRIKISKILKFLTKHLLRLPITDTQCGLKGFTAAGREVFLQSKINRYLFDLEFIFLVSRRTSLHMQPVEVQLKPGIVFSKMNPKVLASEGYSFLKILLHHLLRSA